MITIHTPEMNVTWSCPRGAHDPEEENREQAEGSPGGGQEGRQCQHGMQRPGHMSSNPLIELGQLPKQGGGDIKQFKDYTEPPANSSRILPPNEFETAF